MPCAATARFTATLQIAEEPNVAGNAALDGDYPDVLQAIVSGVATANDEARAHGFEHLQVGVNSTPLFGPASRFYPTLLQAGGRALVDGLAYVGLDMFSDVFRPNSYCAILRSNSTARSPNADYVARRSDIGHRITTNQREIRFAA